MTRKCLVFKTRNPLIRLSFLVGPVRNAVTISSAARCDYFDTLPYTYSARQISSRTKVRTDGENFLKRTCRSSPEKVVESGFMFRGGSMGTRLSSEGRYDHFDTAPCIFSIGFPTKKQLFTCLDNCEQAVSIGSVFLLSEMTQTLYSCGLAAIGWTHNRVDFECGSLRPLRYLSILNCCW